MDSQELFLQDGRSAAAWYCGKCRMTARTHDEAERCCKPHVCDCGAKCVPRGFTSCTACRSARQARLTADKIEKATKVLAKDWDGPVVPDGTDGFASLDEAIEHFCDEDRPLPAPVWGTRPTKMWLDAEGIIEHGVEEMYEGAFAHISEDATRKLQEVLDTWAAEHAPPDGWEEDNSIVIMVDKCPD